MSRKRRTSAGLPEPDRPTPDGRFRRQPHSRWVPCVIRRQLPNGTVEVLDIDRGAVRTLPADRVERETRGPRGGRIFVPFTDPMESP